MDSPQYFTSSAENVEAFLSFKPYYKWIVLNTAVVLMCADIDRIVLNLIING